MLFTYLKKDALITGFISIFIVVTMDMLVIIFILSLLSNLISSDLLYATLRILAIISLLIPPYVAARLTDSHIILHALIIGFIQALLMILLMTQTFSWQGTQQSSVMDKMPLVTGGMLVLSLLSGIFARWMNQKKQR